jgi:hypothetical protein
VACGGQVFFVDQPDDRLEGAKKYLEDFRGGDTVALASDIFSKADFAWLATKAIECSFKD